MNGSGKDYSPKRFGRRALLKYVSCAGLTAGLSPWVWLAGCGKKNAKSRPNIFLVTVDTLRPDHLHCYGYSKKTSPRIDDFARDAVLYEKCFSHAPETCMSVAGILSGFLPHETKVSENTFLSSKVETMPQILIRYGYKTAAVVSNYVLRKGQGFEQGFLVYDDTMKKREIVRGVVERIAEDTTNRAVEIIEQFGKGPMFVWLHYQDPHGPYTPPGRFAEMFRSSDSKARNLRPTGSLTGRGGIPSYQMLGDNTDYNYYVSQYDGEIGYMDEQFGRFVDALKKSGLYDNSLIIFTSDHGEGMGEHDYFFAHGEYLYNDQLHVPLVIKHPAVSSGKKTDFVQHADLLPTILDIIGVDAGKKLRGRCLLKEGGADKEIFAGMRTRYVRDSIKFSLIYGQMKMIYTPIDLRYELFDLKSDFYEEKDLIKDPQYHVQADDLRNRLERIMREDLLGVPIEPQPRELNQQEKDALKSLGYVR